MNVILFEIMDLVNRVVCINLALDEPLHLIFDTCVVDVK